jgi:threonine dehydrogenase-like Zn-dependent dehydrogenase
MNYKAAYLSAPYEMKLKDVEIRDIQDDQILVKVKAVGICGSDIECYTGKSKEGRYDISPYVPGHEWSGEVAEIGKNIKNFKKGDKVTGDCVLHCGKCYNCKSGLHTASCKDMRETGFMPNSPGGMGEYLTIEEQYLHLLPEDMSYEEGALVEPFSVSYFAIWGNGGYVNASDDVVVSGAGPIGLCAAVIAKMAGAQVTVLENIEFRRNIANNLGVDHVISPQETDIQSAVSDITEGRGADLVVEASGNDSAIAAAFDLAGHNGRIRLIGHSVGRKVQAELGLAIWKALSVQGQAGSPFAFPDTIKFMKRAKERFDYATIITHRFPLKEIHKAFDLAIKEKNEAVKVLILP